MLESKVGDPSTGKHQRRQTAGLPVVRSSLDPKDGEAGVQSGTAGALCAVGQTHRHRGPPMEGGDSVGDSPSPPPAYSPTPART